jgi:hypothetical protein
VRGDGEVGGWYQRKDGGGRERGQEGEYSAKNVYRCTLKLLQESRNGGKGQ